MTTYIIKIIILCIIYIFNVEFILIYYSLRIWIEMVPLLLI